MTGVFVSETQVDDIFTKCANTQGLKPNEMTQIPGQNGIFILLNTRQVEAHKWTIWGYLQQLPKKLSEPEGITAAEANRQGNDKIWTKSFHTAQGLLLLGVAAGLLVFNEKTGRYTVGTITVNTP